MDRAELKQVTAIAAAMAEAGEIPAAGSITGVRRRRDPDAVPR